MKICAVALNYNLPKDTINTVADLKRQVLPRYWRLEIVVVDNASTDDSVRQIKTAHPDVTVIKKTTNAGVTGGYNTGIKHGFKTKADYIIVANNDLEITQKSVFKILVEALKTDPLAGCATPLIYFAKGFEYQEKYKKSYLGKIIWYAGGVIDWQNILMSHRGVNEVDQGQFNKTEETDFITGAFMVFPTKVLKKIGLFNESYGMYLEDGEVCERLRRAGYKLLFVPQAKIAHKVSQTATGGIGGLMNDYYIHRNRLLFGLKYARLRTKIALLREAIRLLFTGRPYQKMGIRDFFLGRRRIQKI